MKKTLAYTPHTVLHGGIAHLGDAMPEAAKPATPAATTLPGKPSTQPHKTMTNPARPGRPAKPSKAAPKDEDYSTPYVPPVAPPADKDSLTTAKPKDDTCSPGLVDFLIDDDVPVPVGRCGYGKALRIRSVLAQLQPGQSTRFLLSDRHMLRISMTGIQKTSSARFTLRLRFDDVDTLRVWRKS